MDNDDLKIEQTDILHTQEEQGEQVEKVKPDKNRNLITALIIGGVALGLISLMVVILLFTGWFKHDTGNKSAFDYAPAKNTSITTFDLGMNMGDLVNTVANIAGQSKSADSMMAKTILENIPDLSFVDVKGFALFDQKNSSDFALGLRFSGRSDPQKSLDQVLSKMSSGTGIQPQKDGKGFIDLTQSGTPIGTLYLDDSYLLISQNRQFLEQCLQTKHNTSASIKSHPKWSKINGLINDAPLSYCGIFDIEGKEVVVVGVAQNLSNEVNFKVSWLDGVDQVSDLLGENLPYEVNIADIFKWQKNLSATVSSTPDGTIRFAVPFAVTNFIMPKLEEGETSGFVKMEDLYGKQNYGIRIKADKEKLNSFVELVLRGQNKVTPEKDGVMHVEPFSAIVEPSTNKKTETKTNIKETKPEELKESMLSGRNYPGSPGIGECYYKLNGDTLYIGSSIESLKWKPGRNENVTGSIVSLVVDGKSIAKSLSGILSMYSGMTTGMTGVSNEKLAEILEKIDIKVNVDLLTSDKDLSCVISIKYNLENALR
ncbi:MAG: hypothetical protein HGA95_03740 [Caldiserica bacterium]|nr:hypothetical protein [Caldisericota bacterium]